MEDLAKRAEETERATRKDIERWLEEESDSDEDGEKKDHESIEKVCKSILVDQIHDSIARFLA